ncbi:Indoleamine 2,3-dioxygenase 2 [Branchiostoma belcheri]|nr:Indoleamine 2,3-dioxygenase 2 [Branchiostoma belcheri]
MLQLGKEMQDANTNHAARQPAAMTEANRELRLKSCQQSWCRRRRSPSWLRPRLARLAAGPWPGGRGRERSSLSSTDQSLRHVPAFLPCCIAVPWYHVSEHLGVTPIISHHCVSLANWKKRDPKGPLELDNLQIMYHITCPRDFAWFAIIPLAVEMDFIPGLPLLVQAQKGVAEDNHKLTKDALTAMIPVLKKINQTLGRTREQCDPEVFYNGFRYFLSGWKDNAALPRGLIYQGVREEPFQFSGGSAAQVATLQCLDELLGIKHNSSEAAFLMRMRDYMLRDHRNFIAAVGKGPSVRNFVSNSDDQELRTAYNTCVSLLKDFRSMHIKVVTSFIVIPSKKAKGHKAEGLSSKGTGGTGLLSFLKSVRDTTVAALLPEVPCH